MKIILFDMNLLERNNTCKYMFKFFVWAVFQANTTRYKQISR